MQNMKYLNDRSVEKLGTISISIFKNNRTGLSAFSITDESVEHFSYPIEDTMKKF